jgi:hypothetical protein
VVPRRAARPRPPGIVSCTDQACVSRDTLPVSMSASGENRLPVKSRLNIGQSLSLVRLALFCATMPAPTTRISVAVIRSRDIADMVRENGDNFITRSGDARRDSIG